MLQTVSTANTADHERLESTSIHLGEILFNYARPLIPTRGFRLSRKQMTAGTVELEIENIGGIDQHRAELSSDVTVLSGRNATNRTSFLQAIMAACGSDQATLKADADEGRVVLSIDGEEG